MDNKNFIKNEDAVRFYKIMPSAIEPMRADKSALGTMPAAAFQYCEAMRISSSFGWYIFSPHDIELKWDGSQVYYNGKNGWEILSSIFDIDTVNL